MKLTLRDATIAAISYADIFDYPLTEEEVRVWLPFRVSQESVLRSYYVSQSRRKRLVAVRSKRAQWSKQKWTRARWVGNILKFIPTISLIGVTGGLTRSNARQEDDIDFLIITVPKTLWVTRGLSTILLDIFGLRRRPRDTQFRNLICLNMFMSEDGLSVSKKERDLFTAHEVLLMTPLWERDGAYVKFLKANRWVEKFLPNAWEKRNQELGIRNHGKEQRLGEFFSFTLIHASRFLLQLVEPIAKFIQLRYMNRRRTTEVVNDTLIRFHPCDARVWIRSALGRRLSRLNIPLDKIFYGR